MQLSLAQRIAFGGLCLMAAGLSFSISIAQLGLGIALLVFVAGFFGKSALRENWAGAFGLKVLYVFFVLWALWRLFHVTISPEPLAELREAREVWLMLIPLFIWLYIPDQKRLSLFLTCLVAGAAISSTWGIFALREGLWEPWVRGRGLTTMHHLNYAGVMAIVCLLALGFAASPYLEGKKWQALLVFLAFVLSLGGLWITKSRGAIAAFVLVLPLAIYLQLYNRSHRWIFLGLVALVVAALVPRLPESLREQYRLPPPEVHAGSQAERRDLWLAGWAMVRDRPWLGYGDRGYHEAYPRYQVPGAMGVAAWDPTTRTTSHMHNDFLNTWVLYGGVGLLLQLAFYFWGFIYYLRERFQLSSQKKRHLAAVAATAIVLMALMGLTQCHFTADIVQMAFWSAVGILFWLLDGEHCGR